uniref:PARP catalytic domain-containing protein n=1 Tax=Oryzias melastigma TaxID=30732 RepID=A0A3B3C4B8_ORYME
DCPSKTHRPLLPDWLSYLNTPKPRDGRTYVMYHGTTGANAGSIRNNGFRRSSNGMLGPGVYLSRDLEKARRYPIDHPDEDRVIIKVKVNVGRVIVIKYQNHHLQQTWSSNGYDSAWVPPNCGMVNSGLEENCIWDPSRIQSSGVCSDHCRREDLLYRSVLGSGIYSDDHR